MMKKAAEVERALYLIRTMHKYNKVIISYSPDHQFHIFVSTKLIVIILLLTIIIFQNTFIILLSHIIKNENLCNKRANF